MAHPRPEPTDVEHPVGLHELFFSTTDRRGVIRAGNHTFVRISRYDLSQLVGSPHNIIRHPDMPAGAFAVMWSRLLAGKPMGAYVQNMAADGGSYWVFATVTPLGDGFLSVRSAPCSPTFEIVREIYAGARAEEERWAAAGYHSAEVARRGVRYLEQCFEALGFDSYEEFMFEAMADEVTTRSERLGARTFERPDAVGPAAEVLAAAAELDRELAKLGGRMDRYRSLAAQLAPVSNDMLATAHALEQMVGHAYTASEQSGKKVLSNVARVLGAPMQDATDALTGLAPGLDRVVLDSLEMGFAIALTRLHAEMIASFAAEVIEGIAPDASLGEVRELCDAVDDDVTSMVAGIDELAHQLRDIGDHIESAAAQYDKFGEFLAEWTRLAVRHGTGVPMRWVLEPIDEHFGTGRKHLAALRALAAECREAGLPIELLGFDAHLDRMRAAAAHYAAERAAAALPIAGG